jgi:hypothetical protein
MIDTDELQQELERTQAAFRRWASTTSRAAQEGKNGHARNMRIASGERAEAGAGPRGAGAARARASARRSLACPRHRPRTPPAGEVESLNDQYAKLERQAAEVQQCEQQRRNAAGMRVRVRRVCAASRAHGRGSRPHRVGLAGVRTAAPPSRLRAPAGMSRDCAERDTLRGVAESLVGERTSLQRRLLQMRSELEAETKDAEGVEQGAAPRAAGAAAGPRSPDPPRRALPEATAPLERAPSAPASATQSPRPARARASPRRAAAGALGAVQPAGGAGQGAAAVPERAGAGAGAGRRCAAACCCGARPGLVAGTTASLQTGAAPHGVHLAHAFQSEPRPCRHAYHALAWSLGAADELHLVFTLIDPRDPARPFEFAVKVLEDNTYMGARPAAPPSRQAHREAAVLGATAWQHAACEQRNGVRGTDRQLETINAALPPRAVSPGSPLTPTPDPQSRPASRGWSAWASCRRCCARRTASPSL